MSSSSASIALALLALPCACGLEPEPRTNARSSVQVAEPRPLAPAARALEPYERFLGGVWRCVFSAGIEQYDTWSWGPGRHSLLRTTDGLAGDGTRWRTFQVVYFDPREGRVRSFAMSPHAGGVAHGELRFEGEVLEQRTEMRQRTGPRDLSLRHVFDGPDRYRATLSEHHANSASVEMAVWNYERIASAPAEPPVGEGSEPSRARLRSFEPYVGFTWRSSSASGDSSSLHTRLAWMPQVDALHARVFADAPSAAKDGAAALLDAYVYEDPLDASVHVLAFASSGAVYEGSVEERAAGDFELVLEGGNGKRVESYSVQLAPDSSGTLRERVRRTNGPEPRLLADRWHAALAPARD